MILVIEACFHQSLRSSEIQELIGIRHRETFQRNYLDYLLNEGFLERTIPDKPKSRLQEYKSSDKSVKFLAELRENKSKK